MEYNLHLKAFIYKAYCLTQFSYALETTTLKKETRNVRNVLNVAQNTLIRQMIGLNKFCHMKNILQCIKIIDFEQLYIYTKLKINTIKFNKISMKIFNS